MRKLMFLCLAAFLLTLPVQAEVQYLTTAQFKEKVFDYTKNRDWNYVGKRPAIIDFYTTWCGPCKRLAPIMETLSEKYKGKVIFYKVDTEREREVWPDCLTYPASRRCSTSLCTASPRYWWVSIPRSR